jgi:peptide-methionine (S)-S-oxide reductase
VAGRQETLYIAMGCFWGAERIMEAAGRRHDSGRPQGWVHNPTYERPALAGPATPDGARRLRPDRRAELILKASGRIRPTTLNRQGNDIGTAYRSAIFRRPGRRRRPSDARHFQVS